MVIEYCNYKDLREYLNEKGVLSEIEIEYFFKQVGKLIVSSARWKNLVNGLKTLHEKKIIHRDLKPEVNFYAFIPETKKVTMVF